MKLLMVMLDLTTAQTEPVKTDRERDQTQTFRLDSGLKETGHKETGHRETLEPKTGPDQDHEKIFRVKMKSSPKTMKLHRNHWSQNAILTVDKFIRK
ncbi:Hypothetical predicted protein [Xyrichtys novacula]|uniref:Uncharacterized protein n=1 Tax=Xyrichtys novacula TaxID=13765 RepID=A0AAV1FJR7_XYRNO|nr:Hypothetical predicted protein [Xyrichtys novacula]